MASRLGNSEKAGIFSEPHPVYLSEQLVGEFHSQTAAAFHLGLCYRVITDANASWETCCLREEMRTRGAARIGEPPLPESKAHCSPGAMIFLFFFFPFLFDNCGGATTSLVLMGLPIAT